MTVQMDRISSCDFIRFKKQFKLEIAFLHLRKEDSQSVSRSSGAGGNAWLELTALNN